MNKKGAKTVAAKYDYADEFSCGFGKVGILKPVVDSVWLEGYFEEKGYYMYDTTQKLFYTYVDANGKELPYSFKRATRYSECRAVVKDDSMWGYLNEKGKWLVEPRFVDAKSFKGKTAKITIGTDEGRTWHDAKLKKNGTVVDYDKVGYPKPTWFDSMPDWKVMLAASKDYVRLADESTALGYLSALTRRIDQVKSEDTLAAMEILCRYAHLSADNYKMDEFHKFQPKAAALYDEVIASDLDRKRLMILEYLDHLTIVAEIYRARDQNDKELEMLKTVMDAVKRSGTESPDLYWDIDERIKELEN